MQEIFARVAVGDGSLFVEHLADDVVMRVSGQYSWSRTFTGKQSVLRDLFGVVRERTTGTRKTIPLRFIADGDLPAARRQDRRVHRVPGFDAVRARARPVLVLVQAACAATASG
jgi:ketosteroid isomerase-like protein